MHTAGKEWKAYWTVVLAAAAGTCLGSISTYAFGIFISPLEREFGWSRAGISSGVTIYAAVGVIGAPLAGVLLDRFGARRIGIYSTVAFCVALASLFFVTRQIGTWWAGWLVLGVIALGLKPAVWSKAVTSFFHHARGMAIAGMLCGMGLGSSLIPLLSNWLIGQFGWRLTFVLLAGLFAIIVLPLLHLFLYDKINRPEGEISKDPANLPGWSVAEGMRRRELYQIALAAFIVTTILVGCIVHIVPMLVSLGLARADAVKLVSIIGVMSVTARLIIGYLFDKVQHPWLGAISLASPILPCLILLYGPPGMLTAIFAVITLGICSGGEYDAVIYLSSRYFGLRAFGTLFGVVESALLAGVGVGPLLAGYIFDQTQSYELFLMMAVPASLIGGLQILTLRRYPQHDNKSNHFT